MRLPLRPAALNRLRTTRAIDVLIIGGGINGAGLLRPPYGRHFATMIGLLKRYF